MLIRGNTLLIRGNTRSLLGLYIYIYIKKKNIKNKIFNLSRAHHSKKTKNFIS